ncbi:hypothetical protein BH582_12145 [Vibrio sp. 10N.222.47.A9]|uniref:glycosyltransferase family 2 protein n=1 Tax=Vibrio sp. 10N.222.47.A9 TaxID=1903178 RepID=UPI0009777C84|nr:glycosyltransferase family 2 protein [Vibrio sp. 10N.222.47.A9]OMO31692.1 hypothetical protein BH582_12145 [Vibrio sp. 10N.222.47.A9]
MISIVIPTHNRPKLLKKTIDELSYQTSLGFEVVIVDDGSYPKVESSIFQGLEDKISCHLIRNEVPKGGNYSRNLGIKRATGDFIAFLDDDDLFTHDKIEVIEAAISDSPEIDIFYHKARIVFDSYKINYESSPKSEFKYKDLLISNCIGGTPMVILRKSSMISVGMFNEDMPALQDYELWLRLAKNDYKFRYLDKPLTLYHYYLSESSVSKSNTKNDDAFALIHSIYAEDYNEFTQCELDEHVYWINRNYSHRCLLNNNIKSAIMYQYRNLVKSHSLKDLLRLVSICFGRKFNLFLRGYIK